MYLHVDWVVNFYLRTYVALPVAGAGAAKTKHLTIIMIYHSLLIRHRAHLNKFSPKGLATNLEFLIAQFGTTTCTYPLLIICFFC